MKKGRPLSIVILLMNLLLLPSTVYGQIGHTVSAVGAVNRSMAGAGTAMPLDASGALFANPASITDLESSELELNVEPIFIDADLESSLESGALASGIPSRTLVGETESTIKFGALPSTAYVHKLKNSRWTLGVSTIGVGGFGSNYEHEGDNPITSPPPPEGFGSGELSAAYQLLQFSPTIAYKLTDHLSVGVSPNFDLSALESKPFGFAPPDDADENGFITFPDADKDWALGGGVQGGIYYKKKGLHLGASIKSPQWFESFRFKAKDELGNTRSFKFKLDYPMIVSAGIGYSGLPRLKWAADVKYVDYKNTAGFSKRGIDVVTGALRGAGWKSVWAVASGVQYEFSKKLSLRAGYAFNENPIRNSDAFFNIGAPSILQHHLNAGLSYQIRKNLNLALAYQHSFTNSIQGPFQTIAGPVPNSLVKSRATANNITLSLIFKF